MSEARRREEPGEDPSPASSPPGPRRRRSWFLISVPCALGLAVLLGLCFADRNGKGPVRYEGSGGPSRLDASPSFVDVAPFLGIDRVLAAGSPEKLFIFENVGSGAGILDFDLDGLPDIFLANAGVVREGRIFPGPGVALYRQLSSGRFEDVSARAGIEFRGWGTGVAVGDIENDGDPDVLLGTLDGLLLFRNEGGGHFTESAREAGLVAPGYASSSVFLDYDRDGELDLFVARYVEFDIAHPPNGGRPCLENGISISCGPTMHRPVPGVLFRNGGGGRFEDVTARAGMAQQEGPYGLGVASSDIDGDGWPDIYVANDTTANFLWHNLRNSAFEEIGIEAGCALGENAQGQSGMGVDIADADGDGKPDIFVANYSEEYNAFYQNLGDLSFADRTHSSGLAAGCFLPMGWGTKFIDYDCDGSLDLFVVNGHVHPRANELNPALAYGQPILFYQGDGKGGFRRADGELGKDVNLPRVHRSAPVGDLDGDGDIDILVTVLDAPPVLLMNNASGTNRSILVRLRGVRSNREGIGARLELTAGGRRLVREMTRGGGYLSASDAAVHFGLGALPRADSLRIAWPSGKVDSLGALDAGSTYLIEEGGKVLSSTPHRTSRFAEALRGAAR